MGRHGLFAVTFSVLALACGSKDGDTGSGSGSGSDSVGTASATDGQTSTSGGSGASSATDGSGGSGSGSGGGTPACASDRDCELLTDCCDCWAQHVSEPAEFCNMACDQSACEAWGVSDAVCRDGACAIAPVNCDDSTVACESEPPTCGDGYTPGVSEDGLCWTGACVKNEFCG